MKIIPVAIILFVLTSRGFSQNLISNSSFESGGTLNCQGWFDLCGQELSLHCDTVLTCHTRMLQDSPPKGGNWCLVVNGLGNTPPTYARTFLTGQNGTHVYQLNVWMKSFVLGYARTYTLSKGTLTINKTIYADTSAWKYYSLTDTLTVQSADTIIVSLEARAGGPLQGDVYFDLAEFSVLTNNIYEMNDDLNGISLFPNPSHGILTFRTLNKQLKTLRIFNSAGQLVKTMETSSTEFLNTDRFHPGLYFYQVKTIADGKIIGQGKFVME